MRPATPSTWPVPEAIRDAAIEASQRAYEEAERRRQERRLQAEADVDVGGVAVIRELKTIQRAEWKSIDVPRAVAACPICDEPIVIEEVSEWECENGKPISISIDCTTQPDIDSDEWWDWHRGHWSMPYVDWLPVEMLVLRWFQAHYRMEADAVIPEAIELDPNLSSPVTFSGNG